MGSVDLGGDPDFIGAGRVGVVTYVVSAPFQRLRGRFKSS